jgi:5-methylcytosine-specific restriction endonuclease McrA
MSYLERRVLLLDAGMQPLEIISGRKAIEHLFEGKAEVLEEYEDALIRSARLSLCLPSVMRLFKSHRSRHYVKFSRPNVFWRDNYLCQYCMKKKPKNKLTLDHVIPKCTRSAVSHKSWENIVTACFTCNQRKAGRTPEQAGMKLHKKPYKPAWEPEMTIQLMANDPASWKQYISWSE